MKDITIKGSTVRHELLWIATCFVAAFLINTYAVVHFDRPAIELLSQLGFVVVITAALYILLAVVRVVVMLLSIPFKRNNHIKNNQ